MTSSFQVSITVLGIGNGGCNVVRSLSNNHLHCVSLVTCNTEVSDYPDQTQYIDFSKETSGYGTGGDTAKAKEIVTKHKETIKESIQGSEMLLIVSTLGGGFGTGASPEIAKIAKEMGILTICIVTLPFDFEFKETKADQGILQLREHADVIIELPNQKLFNSNANDNPDNFFQQTDFFIEQCITGIVNVLNTKGEINVDFADMQTIMTNQGASLIGQGSANGKECVSLAIDKALSSPLLQDTAIKSTKGILVNIVGNVGILSLDEGMQKLKDISDQNVHLILGYASFQEQEQDHADVTLILTGVPQREIVAKPEFSF